MYRLLDHRLAQEIVDKMKTVLPFNINVMDARGVIIGSGEVARIGELHWGAQQVLALGKRMEITEAMAATLMGVKAGVNLAMRVRGTICGVIGITGKPEAVRHYGELVRASAEMLLEQALLLDELKHAEQYRDEVLLQLLKPRASREFHDIEARASRLGIEIHAPHTVVLLSIPEGGRLSQALFTELRHFQHMLQKKEAMSVVVSPNTLVIISRLTRTPEPQGVLEVLSRLQHIFDMKPVESPYQLAAGLVVKTIEGIIDSYQSACEARRVGLQRYPEGTRFSYYELSLPVLLGSFKLDWQAAELLRPIQKLKDYGKKHKNQAETLIHTIRTWFACDEHFGDTAKALGIHRNTLDYRLGQVMRITEMNLTKTEARFLLYLALQRSA